MVVYNKFFSTVLIAVLCSTLLSHAHPFPTSEEIKASNLRRASDDDDIPPLYIPDNVYEILGEHGVKVPATKRASNSKSMAIALRFIATLLKKKPEEVVYNTGSESDGISYAYLKQAIDGIPIANAVANVALKDNSELIQYGHSFVDTTKAKVAPKTAKISIEDAKKTAEKRTKAKFNTNSEPTTEYLNLGNGNIALVHVIQVKKGLGTVDDAKDSEDGWTSDSEQDDLDYKGPPIFKEVYVDAQTNKVVSALDFVKKASYRVADISKKDVIAGQELLQDPAIQQASPFGWHNSELVAGKDSKTTIGNNVSAYMKSKTGVKTPSVESAAGGIYDYTYDLNIDPEDRKNKNPSRTTGFYIANIMHDITYLYGFTEDTFNFQFNNNGKGGKDKDRVMMSILDPSDTGNAYFMTPPDGQPPSLVTHIFQKDEIPGMPKRDPTMFNEIVVHEYGHGVTGRMTGGGTARCLDKQESKGLGEGWSDALSEWMVQTSSTVDDFYVGAGFLDNQAGIRNHPFSEDKTKNPLTYGSLKTLTEEHAVGEIWANMLHIVYIALVKELGFSDDFRTNPDTDSGNVLFMKLFIEALKLQPCNPTFVDARKAWIQAAAKYKSNGVDVCTLWTAFASRGLGVSAKNHVDTKPDDVPPECVGGSPTSTQSAPPSTSSSATNPVTAAFCSTMQSIVGEIPGLEFEVDDGELCPSEPEDSDDD